METILQLIKRNAVPASVMRTASRGALPIPADQMLEVLVYLTGNPVFAHDAKLTLAGWDLNAAIKVVSDPAAPAAVLSYYWAGENRRPALMPALIENQSIAETLLMELASEAPREIIAMLVASVRVRRAPGVIEALATNPRVTPEDLEQVRGQAESGSMSATGLAVEAPADPESQAAQDAFQQEHAAEIQAVEAQPFQLVGEEVEAAPGEAKEATEDPVQTPEQIPEPPTPPVTEAKSSAAAPRETEGKKLTLLQRVGRMTASERVKAAFTGSREERAVLIRDGAKVVQNAVLASPKLTEPEVEVFAAAKNVHENVLREIARSRRFMKNYSVMRNLVLNPKTPVDISMPLVKMLMVFDLKALQRSRNVSESIRKLATKYYREKAMSGGKTSD